MTDHATPRGADFSAEEIETHHQVDTEKDLRLRARARDALRLLRRSKGGMFGAFVFVMLLILATFAPWIAPHDPLQQTLSDANTPPFWSDGGSNDYLIGTDTLGRDILSRIIFGTRVSLGCGSRWRWNRHHVGYGDRSDRRLPRRQDRRRDRRFQSI